MSSFVVGNQSKGLLYDRLIIVVPKRRSKIVDAVVVILLEGFIAICSLQWWLQLTSDKNWICIVIDDAFDRHCLVRFRWWLLRWLCVWLSTWIQLPQLSMIIMPTFIVHYDHFFEWIVAWKRISNVSMVNQIGIDTLFVWLCFLSIYPILLVWLPWITSLLRHCLTKDYEMYQKYQPNPHTTMSTFPHDWPQVFGIVQCAKLIQNSIKQKKKLIMNEYMKEFGYGWSNCRCSRLEEKLFKRTHDASLGSALSEGVVRLGVVSSSTHFSSTFKVRA